MLCQSGKVQKPVGLWPQTRVWAPVAVAVAALLLSSGGNPDVATGEPAPESAQPRQVPWAPELYAFDLEASDAMHRSLAEEAQMLRQLGFDGAGYLLVGNAESKLRLFGEDLDQNLRTLDEAALPLLALGGSVNVDPNAPRPYDRRLGEAIRKVKGRPVVIEVMLEGLPPGDERGTEPAVKALRQLGDLAAESKLRISVYHHAKSWAQSFDDALRVVNAADHPCVGVNFNLCHWLMVDGDKDYRDCLRAGGEKIFVVTINGAKVGSKTAAQMMQLLDRDDSDNPELAAILAELIQPLDQGNFDNRQLLATLRQIGFRGPVGLQCFGIPGDARQHLQRSMNVWKAWQAEWAKEKP